jgi:hypothetical protein
VYIVRIGQYGKHRRLQRLAVTIVWHILDRGTDPAFAQLQDIAPPGIRGVIRHELAELCCDSEKAILGRQFSKMLSFASSNRQRIRDSFLQRDMFEALLADFRTNIFATAGAAAAELKVEPEPSTVVVAV